MNDEVKAAQENNAEHFAERGPGLSYAYKSYIVGRDGDFLLLGGLGGMGVGHMWVGDHERYHDGIGYADAPYAECPEDEQESVRRIEGNPDLRGLENPQAVTIHLYRDDPEVGDTAICGHVKTTLNPADGYPPGSRSCRDCREVMRARTRGT